MEQKNCNLVNTYIQGSIWIWNKYESNNVENRQGVQSTNRPVLVISNNTFNQFSPVVNCLSITSVLKNNPVHVLFTLEVDSHILCEQIHTIPKRELVEYKGVLAPITLSIVKSKLAKQFDMTTDRSLEILTDIKNSLEDLNIRAENGFGFQETSDDMANTLINIHKCFTVIKDELSKIQANNNENRNSNEQKLIIDNTKNQKSDEQKLTTVIKNTEHLKKPLKSNMKQNKNHKNYTDEEIAFLLDTDNSTNEIISKFGFNSRTKVYQMRSYYKRKNQDITTEIDKNTTKTKRRRYTNEEIEYIINKNNSIDDIMIMLDFKNKATAYKMRAYFKKRYPDLATDS